MAFRIFSKFLLATTLLAGLVNASPLPADLSVERRSPGTVTNPSSPVQMGPSGSWPRVTRLYYTDQSLLGAYEYSDGSDKVLRVVKSTNEGQSWTLLGEVARRPAATSDMANPMPLQLQSGRIVLAFRNHDMSSGVYTQYRLTVSYSDDGGVTWKFLSTILERTATATKNGLWEPYLRLARDGTLQVYYSAENNDGDQDNFLKYSKDGVTWSGQQNVSGGDRTSRDGMTGVAPINDAGKCICVFENTESGAFSIDYVISNDDGYTWGSRTRLYTAANGKNAGAPYVHNVWGTLVVSFMTNENSGTPGIDGGQMKVLTSTNGAGSWSGAVVVADTGSYWGGLFNLDPTHFLAAYSKNGLGVVSQKWQLV